MRPPMAVGPGRASIAPALVGGRSRDGVSGYTIQPGKVQPPPLRAETLARHRLLDWLDVKVHNRVLFVIADAGYGKTTLLADFTRKTRLRTLWYRMDEEDRNWVAFLSYLVAAGRVHDPEFAPRTAALLGDTGPGGANRDDVVDAFVRELPSMAADGAALILDDFHVADDVADVTHVARELVMRAPERLTLIVSSRRIPTLPVARLRALGEVAELRTAELRFSTEETKALFAETYGHALEPDVLADLSRRTDGWAASLHLVRTALRDRSAAETRAFVRSLSGAQSELYDYLAEEVVGDLAADLQTFLMRTSVLQGVDPEAAGVATGFDSRQVASHVAEAERLGLLSRRQATHRTGHGYHPLVREFLEARLRRDVGDAEVATLHRSVAAWAESRDWAAACYHYAAAGDTADLHRMLDSSIENIVGTGEIALAADYLARFPPDITTANYEIIRSRQAANAGDIRTSVAYARNAVALDPASEAAAMNMLGSQFQAGDLAPALGLAERLATTASSVTLRQIGAATQSVLEVSLDGDLDQGLTVLASLTDLARRQGHVHYVGVSLLNSALLRKAQGAADEALRNATDAIDALAAGSAIWELQAAHLAQAWAHAHLGDLPKARSILSASSERASSATRPEWLLEALQIETWYGDHLIAEGYADQLARVELAPSMAPLARLAVVELAIRVGDIERARKELPQQPPVVPTQEPGMVSHYQAIAAHLAVVDANPGARDLLHEAFAFASRQGAWLWASIARTLLAAVDARDGEDRLTVQGSATVRSMVAETLIMRFHQFGTETLDTLRQEAESRPERWRASLRAAVSTPDVPYRIHAARILDVVGGPTDVQLLRSVAKLKSSRADSTLGKGLARRLAAPVMVEDQGRVQLILGSVVVPGSDLRRKVLALMCFLLTKPGFAATRDEVIDALWPDLVPEVAVNSLNQTVYFLRRVFEPTYKEDVSAGYVHHESDVLWLDPELIQSRSRRCRDYIDALVGEPSPEAIDHLVALYQGPFALDFSYEEWAVPFRDSLHVAYVHLMESAVNRDLEAGHFDRGIRVARRALEVDPDLENVQLSLLRLYRATGAHSAAAEQYARYATYLREEHGVEAPPLAAL